MKGKILGFLALVLLAGPLAANSVPYEANIFVRGSFNDWSANPGDRMSYNAPSETYQATVFVGAGFHNFRIASYDWSIDLGNLGGSPLVQLNVPRQLAAGGSNLVIDLAATGHYNFLLDTRSGLDTPTLLVSVYDAAEPGTLALLGLGLGLAGLGLSGRRKAV